MEYLANIGENISKAALIIDKTYPQAIWQLPDLYIFAADPQILCTNEELSPSGKNNRARLTNTTETRKREQF